MTTAYKLKVNGYILPDVYFRWDDAMAARERVKETTVAASVTVITVYE